MRRIKRLPVMRDGIVIGMITRANLMRALLDVSVEAKPISPGDAAIRDRLVSELKKQPWAPVRMTDVFVRDGVVRLTGTLTDERERQALRVAAENIPGVRKVEDRLVWIEPMSGMVLEAPAA
jgi:BON domain